MEGIPRTVLRGHDRLVSSIFTIEKFIFSAYHSIVCAFIINQSFLFFAFLYSFLSDELGNVVAWRKSESEILEFENIHRLHLNSSSITTVSAIRIRKDLMAVYVQVKSGYIYEFNFNEISGFKKVNDPIPCGTFTFCRMSLLKIKESGYVLLAYPSVNIENGINVVVLQKEDYRSYLLKDFMTQSSGMCLFTKLKRLKDSRIILICGYENGKILVINCENGKLLFEDKCFEDGESCTDADFYEGVLVAVGTGKTIKIIKGLLGFDKLTSAVLKLPFPGCNSVSIRSDGKLFVTGGWDCKLRFFSLKSLRDLAVLDYHFDAISDVEIREEDSSIVAACSDGTISIWTLF